MLFRRSKGKRPADGTMSLMEHLYELRRRLFYAVVGIFLGAVFGFIWYTLEIPGVGSLGHILTEPYCKVPMDYRLVKELPGQTCQMVATTPFSILQVRLKAALLVGAVLSAPIWLGQLWGFVTPALHDKERRFARIFVAAGTVLFAGGTVLAYLVLPEAFKMLLSFGGDTALSAMDPNAYYSFLIAVLLIFGLSFELPLVLVMLNFVGVVKGAKLATARRYAYFALVVFSGLVVPGNDPLTMLALAVSLCLLYEIAVQITKIHDRRKDKRLAADGYGDLAGLSDDEASPMPQGAAVGGQDPIAAPAPVPAADPVPVADAVGADGSQGSRSDLGDAT